jgi:mono/diheme cytochrome c family protein
VRVGKAGREVGGWRCLFRVGIEKKVKSQKSKVKSQNRFGLGLRALGLALAAAWVIGVVAFAADDGDAKAGQKVFAAQCAKCHEADSKIYRVGPGLKGIKDGELPSGEPAKAEVILEIINDGREEMPPVGNELTEQQKKDVIAYVLTL